jgi:hypothetical protein
MNENNDVSPHQEEPASKLSQGSWARRLYARLTDTTDRERNFNSMKYGFGTFFIAGAPSVVAHTVMQSGEESLKQAIDKRMQTSGDRRRAIRTLELAPAGGLRRPWLSLAGRCWRRENDGFPRTALGAKKLCPVML